MSIFCFISLRSDTTNESPSSEYVLQQQDAVIGEDDGDGSTAMTADSPFISHVILLPQNLARTLCYAVAGHLYTPRRHFFTFLSVFPPLYFVGSE